MNSLACCCAGHRPQNLGLTVKVHRILLKRSDKTFQQLNQLDKELEKGIIKLLYIVIFG